MQTVVGTLVSGACVVEVVVACAGPVLCGQKETSLTVFLYLVFLLAFIYRWIYKKNPTNINICMACMFMLHKTFVVCWFICALSLIHCTHRVINAYPLTMRTVFTFIIFLLTLWHCVL